MSKVLACPKPQTSPSFHAVGSRNVARAYSAGVRPAKRPHVKDPLIYSPNAKHFQLTDGSTLIIRPPSSVVPPEVVYPSPQAQPDSEPSPSPSSSRTNTHPLAGSSALPTASFSFTPPSSATLPSLYDASEEHTAPPLNPRTTSSPAQLTPAQIEELQRLRTQDPLHWTRKRLAERYGCSPYYVGIVGFGRDKLGRERRKELKGVLDEKEKLEFERMGWNKRIIKEERRGRRAVW